MFYDLSRRSVFIHVPRTAGTAMTTALTSHCPAGVALVREHKHATAAEIREMLAEEWGSLFRFAVLRNPWELIASDYRHTVASAAAAIGVSALDCTAYWIERMRRTVSYRDFGEFVCHEWLGQWSPLLPGGFWRSYCLGPDGEDLGVEVFRFDQLAEAWGTICGKVGLPVLPLPVVNRTDPVACSAEYTPALRDAVGERCRGDVERFGWSPPAADPDPP